MLATDVAHAPVAAQTGEHDLRLPAQATTSDDPVSRSQDQPPSLMNNHPPSPPAQATVNAPPGSRSADDSAGLAISEKLRAQIGGIAQSQRNAQDAVSLVGTAEGALAEVHSMLSRVRDLAVQFNNGTLSATDKAAVTAEISQLCAEVSRIGSDTSFNGLALLTTRRSRSRSALRTARH